MDETPNPGNPSPARQSWGALISIVVIVLMIVVGAFYAWGERAAQAPEPLVPSPATTTDASATTTP